MISRERERELLQVMDAPENSNDELISKNYDDIKGNQA